jgi:putative flippase GtrA
MAQVTPVPLAARRPYYEEGGTLAPEGRSGERASARRRKTASGDAARGSKPASGLLLLGRHQIGGLVATLIDFTVMTLVVDGLSVNAELGTSLGATCGAVANFALGRYWIFRRASAPAAGQAARYAVVSLTSLLCNTLGEYVLHERCGIQYQLARVGVALLVSVVWNFPMQRTFVFGVERASRTARVAP